MSELKTFMESGILESYVLNSITFSEKEKVELMAAIHPAVRSEIENITIAMESYAVLHAVEPPDVVKAMVMATIDYSERMNKGEEATFPPELFKGAALVDYSTWLHRNDMVLPADFKNLHVKIIGYTPAMISAIVWIKSMAPQEVHDNEFEKFLILEGTCDIIIGEKVHSLVPGDVLEIPLHINHHVIVTSIIPCKVILQRIAA